MSKQKKKSSAFGNLGDMMDMGGMSSVLSAVGDADRPTFSMIGRDEIKLYEQQRNKDELETEEQSLEELAADMRAKGMLQPIILCQNEGGPEAWRLVAGERRYRASAIANIHDLPAMCYGVLAEQQIKDIQLAENIHRLNLSQLNEAQVLQQRLNDEFAGDVGALCGAISKSRSWVSKRLGLLDLPEQTQRLVEEGVTADIEVINQLKVIENIDAEAAKETVETLKAEKGEKGANARKTVKEAKDKVKPPKAGQAGKAEKAEKAEEGGSYAQPRDKSYEEHGEVTSLPSETLENDPALIGLKGTLDSAQGETAGPEDGQGIGWLDGQPEPATEDLEQTEEKLEATETPAPVDLEGRKVLGLESTTLLDQAFNQIHGGGEKAATEFVGALSRTDKYQIDDWLCAYYEAGIECENLALAVLQGFRSGKFSETGHRAYALAAFLTGCEDGATFNLVNVLGCAK